MTDSAIDECIRNKRYSEAASLVVKNYKLSRNLESYVATKLKEHHTKKLRYLRQAGRSFLDIAREAHVQTIDDLLSGGLIKDKMEDGKDLHEILNDDEGNES